MTMSRYIHEMHAIGNLRHAIDTESKPHTLVTTREAKWHKINPLKNSFCQSHGFYLQSVGYAPIGAQVLPCLIFKFLLNRCLLYFLVRMIQSLLLSAKRLLIQKWNSWKDYLHHQMLALLHVPPSLLSQGWWIFLNMESYSKPADLPVTCIAAEINLPFQSFLPDDHTLRIRKLLSSFSFIHAYVVCALH